MTTLKAMTWRHPRGYDPMVGTSAIWKEKTGVDIIWEQRSLQDFESFPVEDLARQYDLIVIDHPHVGEVVSRACLAALDTPERNRALTALSLHSVGPSFKSYTWQGSQWALPIDAAAQVQMWRPDLIDAPLGAWSEVLVLARQGQIILPLLAPHALMCFFTLAANLGTPCAMTGPDLIAQADGIAVVDVLAELFAELDEATTLIDPIEASEAMASAGSRLAVMPLGYGYMNYALEGFRPHRVLAADIPVLGADGPLGSAVGGTGIAVSAFGDHIDLATDYAFWVAGAEVQSRLYASLGGQPGHAAGWENDQTNAETGNFYTATRATLEGGWLRPRHNGYMGFQHAGSERLLDGLRNRERASSIVSELNRMFASSFETA